MEFTSERLDFRLFCLNLSSEGLDSTLLDLVLGCEGLNFSLLRPNSALPMLEHFNLVLVSLWNSGCSSSDLAKDLGSLWPVSWGITQTLADQPHQWVVLTDISEVLGSTIKF